MSLLQQGLLLQQAVLPYTFTTGELDSLKAKLQSAENQMMQSPNKQQPSMLPMAASEIRTLLRMIDMTYLQGLSGSGILPSVSQPDLSGMSRGQHQSNYIMPGHYDNSNQSISNQSASNPLQHILHNQLANNSSLSSALHNNILSAHQFNNSFNNPLSSLSNMSSMSHSGSGYGHTQHHSNKNPPPQNYVCHKCNVAGHWIQECTLMNTNQQAQTHTDYSKPPPNNYLCHRCGIPGHYIKNCPTNGNPSFNNKPHLSGDTNSSSTGGVQGVVNGQVVNQSVQDESNESNIASQPPSKKRRLNQI